MTKNSSSLFSRSRERRRPTPRAFSGVGYSALAGEESGEEAELRVVSVRRQHVLERTLQPGDSLQSIALQYHVPVSELKRLNNILRENEIHARTTLRIPVPPLSSLVDVTPVHGERREVALGAGCDPGEFLAAMDRDLARIRAAVPQPEGDPPEVLFNPAGDRSCSGADWGLGWQQMLVCSLLLTFILPILIWYQREQAEGPFVSNNATK